MRSDTITILRQFTHILHVFWFVCWGVPAVVEDENVGLWQTFIYFVEKVFFLDDDERREIEWRLSFLESCEINKI